MLRQGEKLIVIGPTPPPSHGVAVMTPNVIEAVRAVDRLAAHLDTRDSRPVYTIGRFDLRNVLLGIRHAAELLVLLARHRGAAVYLPLSQGTWGFLRDAVFIWSAALSRRRVIVHLHGGGFAAFAGEAGPGMRRLISATMRRVNEAWVLTPPHRTMFAGLIPDARVKVLQNTADDIGAQINGRAGSGEEPTTRLLYLSSLFPEKGCFDLLDALEVLGARGRGLEVRFAGAAEPDTLSELRARARRLTDHGVKVRFDGAVDGPDKLDAFAWAQVFVLPTRYPPEGQPLALLEAMSASLPVISTDFSGIPYTVRDGVEGLIVPPGNPDALAAAILRLVDDVALRERLGASARRRFDDAYRQESFEGAVADLLLLPTS